MSFGIISLTVSVLLALAGYLFTYWNNVRIARHQARLELVNQRLDRFYGPLYVISKTMQITYQTQLSKLGRASVYTEGKAPSAAELKEIQIWVTEVYAPLEEELSNLIVHNAHLIREQNMPDPLLTLVAHVSVSKALIQKWRNNDFSELYPAIDFPYKEITSYAETSYTQLKHEQLRLMGKSNNI